MCSRINTAEGEASLFISPKKTTDKPELCVVSLDLFTGLRFFFFSSCLERIARITHRSATDLIPESLYDRNSYVQFYTVVYQIILFFLYYGTVTVPVVILKTSDEQSLDKRHGVLIRGCPQGFKCYVSFWLHARVRDTTGKSPLSQRLMRVIINENGPDLAVTSGTSRPSCAHSAHPLTAPRVPPLRRGVYWRELIFNADFGFVVLEEEKKKGGGTAVGNAACTWLEQHCAQCASFNGQLCASRSKGWPENSWTHAHARTHAGTTA